MCGFVGLWVCCAVKRWVCWVFGCIGCLGVVFFGFFFLRRNCVGLGMNFFFGLASDDDDEESGLAQGILKQTD